MELIKVEDVFGLGKALNSPAAGEIAKAISAAAGIIIEPANIFAREAVAGAVRRHQLKKDAEAAAQIEAMYANNPVIAEATRARLLGIEYQRTERIINATQRAAQIASDAAKPEEEVHPIDEDFAREWTEAVKDTSHPDIVDMFATLLASAIKTPNGRYPKVSIELVRRMEPEGAAIFKELMGMWRWAKPLPKPVIDLYFRSFEQSQQIALLMDAGAIKADTAAEIAYPGFDAVGRRPGGRIVQGRYVAMFPTETGRILANALYESGVQPEIDVDRLFASLDDWLDVRETGVELDVKGVKYTILPANKPLPEPPMVDLDESNSAYLVLKHFHGLRRLKV